MIPDFSTGPRILMYHSIDDHPDDPYSVTVDAFRQQIAWLSDNGFEVVSLQFLLRAIQTGDHRAVRKKVVITFDDGCRDFVDNALPVLQAQGATATMFLVTEMFGGRSSWNKCAPDVPLMIEDEVRFIRAQGISLGSHTATHAKLTELGVEELRRQVVDSRDTLARLGESFFALSYPWGQWSDQVVTAVKAAGFECALAVGEMTRLTAADAYRLPRITMTRDMGLKRFHTVMTRPRIEIELRRRYRMLRETRSIARVIS